MSTLVAAPVLAETFATTDDGKRVVLQDDGSWRFAAAKPGEGAEEKASPKSKQEAAAPSFRNARWGMSQKDVRRLEKGKPEVAEEGMLVWGDEVGGLDVAVAYIFSDGKLVRGRYHSVTTHTNHNAYIVDYETLKKLLTSKYGEPTSDEVVWSNDLYRNDSQRYGMAVAAGHLSAFTTWETPETKISVAISGDNFEVRVGVDYVSKKLGGLEDEERLESEKQKL